MKQISGKLVQQILDDIREAEDALPRCKQTKCEAPAIGQFRWVGDDWSEACSAHLPYVAALAETMGFTLEQRPLKAFDKAVAELRLKYDHPSIARFANLELD